MLFICMSSLYIYSNKNMSKTCKILYILVKQPSNNALAICKCHVMDTSI